MIPPGDQREVYERVEDYAKKLAQAERKLAAARSALPQICSILGLDATRDWKLGGIVIVDGTAGVPSSKPNFIPIVAKEIFIEVLRITESLDRTHAIFCSPLWLPRQELDFHSGNEEAVVCGMKFRHGNFRLTGRSYLKETLPRYIAASATRSSHELRTDPW
jgi:hypothetical protein